MVLVPQQYSGALQLLKQPQIPCAVDTTDKLCNLYKYINLDKKGFITVEAENPGRTRLNVPLFNDTTVLSKLEYKAMVQLSPQNVRSLLCKSKSHKMRFSRKMYSSMLIKLTPPLKYSENFTLFFINPAGNLRFSHNNYWHTLCSRFHRSTFFEQCSFHYENQICIYF